MLGPLHCLSYVNDMGNILNHSTYYQFDDDIGLLMADKDP